MKPLFKLGRKLTKAEKETKRSDNIKAAIHEQAMLRRDRIKAEKVLLQTKYLNVVKGSKKIHNLVINSNHEDPVKLFEHLMDLSVVFEADTPLTKPIIHSVNEDKSTTMPMIEILRTIGIICGDSSRWMRWCDRNILEALSYNPRGVYNSVLNKIIQIRARKNFLIQTNADGKVKIHKHPKTDPYTEEEKAAMLNKAKEDEHIKRMGIGTEAFSEVKNIHESAEVEVARMPFTW